MKRYFIILVTAVAAIVQAAAQTGEAPLPFPLPEVPASIEGFTERTDWFVVHYWDRCNFKNAFSRRQAMGDALASFLQFLPTASRDAVHKGLDNLLGALKGNPDGMAYMVDRALGELYSDSARYTSDEVTLRFLEAGAANKKIDRDRRERYALLAERIGSSMTGRRVADVAMTLRDGGRSSLGAIIDADTTSITIVYLFDPADPQLALDRTRLDADPRLNAFIDSGQLKMVALSPGEADARWEKEAARMPEKWTVGASPEAWRKLDLMVFPGYYILGNRGDILKKNLTTSQLLDILYNI